MTNVGQAFETVEKNFLYQIIVIVDLFFDEFGGGDTKLKSANISVSSILTRE